MGPNTVLDHLEFDVTPTRNELDCTIRLELRHDDTVARFYVFPGLPGTAELPGFGGSAAAGPFFLPGRTLSPGTGGRPGTGGLDVDCFRWDVFPDAGCDVAGSGG